MKTETIAGQPSWCFTSDKVKAALTKCGGQLAPVSFQLGSRKVEPFSIAPWAGGVEASKQSRMLQALRGDFFCAPFGGGDLPYRKENHPPHGETANADWKFKSLEKGEGRTTLRLSLGTKARKGRVDKWIQLRQGQTVLYCRHRLSGLAGKMSLGHHAMLKFQEKEIALVSTSRLRLGQVAPEPFEDAVKGGYSSLKTGASFDSLDKVPTLIPGYADLSLYPARRGFDDLVMIAHWDKPEWAWTAVVFPRQRYVWFSLKDPRVLQSTVFWISNGGRHYPPWNGKHVNVLGIEDVTSYFHYGLPFSARTNEWNRRGLATCLSLKKSSPLTVNYIMGVAEIPSDFGRVKRILPDQNGITLVSDSGQKKWTGADLSFLYAKS